MEEEEEEEEKGEMEKRLPENVSDILHISLGYGLILLKSEVRMAP